MKLLAYRTALSPWPPNFGTYAGPLYGGKVYLVYWFGFAVGVRVELRRPRCAGCGNEIDPDVCGCGDSITHSAWDFGHEPVPMGCDCGRDDGQR